MVLPELDSMDASMPVLTALSVIFGVTVRKHILRSSSDAVTEISDDFPLPGGPIIK